MPSSCSRPRPLFGSRSSRSGRNRALLSDASSAVAYVEAHVEADTVDTITIDRLEPLRLLVELLQAYEEEGEPWEMRMGMYRGRRLYPRLRDVYVDTVRRDLLLPTMEDELAQLRRFAMLYGEGKKPVSPERYAEQFAHLRLYLLLTQDKGAVQPPLADAELDFAATMLALRWERPLRLVGDRGTVSSIEAVARTYLEIVAGNDALLYERDAALVERVRKILKRADRTQALTDAVVAAVDGKPLTLPSMLGSSRLRNERQIRPAFTRDGYMGTIKPLFAQGVDALLDPQWVIEPDRPDAGRVQAQELADIESEYFRRYIQEWRDFLASTYLDVPAARTGADSLVLLTDLTRSQPFTDLFTAVEHHTQLVPPPAATAPDQPNALKEQIDRTANIAGTRLIGRGLAQTPAGRYGVTTGVVKAGAEALASEHIDGEATVVRAVTEHDLQNAFAPLVKFGARPDAPEGSPPKPSPVGEYEEQLLAVREAMELWFSDPSERAGFKKKLKVARAKLNALIAAETGRGWAPTLEKLLRPPLDIMDGLIDTTEAHEGTRGWCTSVTGAVRTQARPRLPV